MIILLTEQDYNARLRAAGLVATSLMGEEREANIRVWVYDGEPCTPPEPYDSVNGLNRYCAHGLRLFLKRLKGAEQNPSLAGDLGEVETKSCTNVKYHVKDKE
jgi:hypothetical protein